MRKQQRWSMIIELCSKHSNVEVHELTSILAVSEATIRRDLQQMEELKIVTRYHGGAKLCNEQYEEPPMIIKTETNTAVKKKVARLAANMIQDNQIIYIDAGSSAFEMLYYITAKNITIVTNGIHHIETLKKKNLHTILLGGIIRPSTEATTGHYALKQLDELYFDISFIGVNGIHEKVGFTTTNELEADVKSKVMQHSTVSYILADNTKFNKLYPVKFANLNEGIILSDEISNFNTSSLQYILIHGEQKIFSKS